MKPKMLMKKKTKIMLKVMVPLIKEKKLHELSSKVNIYKTNQQSNQNPMANRYICNIFFYLTQWCKRLFEMY